MSIEHTTTSRIATFVTTLLVLVQTLWLLEGGHESYVDALLFSLIAVTAAAGAKLHRDNCVESRMAVSLLAAISGGGAVLGAAVGTPGHHAGGWSTVTAVTLFLSVVVIALLAADRPRRMTERRTGQSYAS